MDKQIKISIIVPVYNGEKTIKRSIDSILSQTINQFEIIVVDDGSTDGTEKILKSYSKYINIIKQENCGAVKAANKGFKVATGHYLIKLDADDYFLPDILEKTSTILDENINIDFVYCDYYEKEADGTKRIITTENIFNTVAIGVMYRKSKFAAEYYYNDEINFAEYDLLLRTRNKWAGYRIPSPLFIYNRREDSLTKNNGWVEKSLEQLLKWHPSINLDFIRKY